MINIGCSECKEKKDVKSLFENDNSRLLVINDDNSSFIDSVHEQISSSFSDFPNLIYDNLGEEDEEDSDVANIDYFF